MLELMLGARVRAILGSVLIAGLAAGCGGNDDDTDAKIRLINASPDYASLSLQWDGSTVASSVALGSASGYGSVAAGTETTTLYSSDSAAALVSTDRTVAESTPYTIVAYGWAGALKTVIMTDNEEAPSSGYAKLRVFNTATDAGSLDVYLTSTDTTLANSSPVISAVSGGSFNSTGYVNVNQGTWRLRVTSNGSTTDLRFDQSALTLSNQQVYTLILTPTTGGVMVNTILAKQGDTVTATDTKLARARLVAGVGSTSTPTVSAVLGGTTLSSGSSSPSVGAYVTVPTGTSSALDVKVNGTALSTTSLDVKAGAELSLMVAGDVSAPQLIVLDDDNRLPATSYAKVRLVNGTYGLGSGLFMSVDYAALASDVTFGTASDYSTIAATGSTTSVLSVSSSSGSLYDVSDLNLQSKGIYTAFLLGLSSSPQGVLRKDR